MPGSCGIEGRPRIGKGGSLGQRFEAVEDQGEKSQLPARLVVPAQVRAAGGAKGGLPHAVVLAGVVEAEASDGPAARGQGVTAHFLGHAAGGGEDVFVAASHGDTHGGLGHFHRAGGAGDAVGLGQRGIVEDRGGAVFMGQVICCFIGKKAGKGVHTKLLEPVRKTRSVAVCIAAKRGYEERFRQVKKKRMARPAPVDAGNAGARTSVTRRPAGQ